MSASPDELPACPRCGYDQTGVVQSWRNECPLRMLCSECGLDLDVARVVNPGRFRVAWFFEHAPPGRAGVSAAWRTGLRTVLPWRFWRQSDGVRLDSEFSLRRLLLWLPLLIAPLYALNVLLYLSTAGIMVLGKPPPARPGASWWASVMLNALLTPPGLGHFDVRLSYHAELHLPCHIAAWLCCGILVPAMLMLLSRSRADCRIRARHVLRAAVYGLGVLALWPAYIVWFYLRNMLPLPISLTNSLGLRWDSADWQLATLIGGLSGAAWVACWWYVVIVRTFRLPHARWVWASLMFAYLLLFILLAAAMGGLEHMLM